MLSHKLVNLMIQCMHGYNNTYSNQWCIRIWPFKIKKQWIFFLTALDGNYQAGRWPKLSLWKSNLVLPFLIRAFMSCWHGGIMHWLSSMLTNVLQVRSQPGTNIFVLPVCYCVLFLASLNYQEHAHLYPYGGVNCLNSVTYRFVKRMHRSSPFVPLDSSLTAAACFSSVCKRMFIRWITSQWFGLTSWVCSLRGH